MALKKLSKSYGTSYAGVTSVNTMTDNSVRVVSGGNTFYL
jgi:hypothetical protein